MSEIRVGYTGLIAFAVSIISIFTALIFTVLLTRGLSTNDFGLWHLILGFIGYGIIIESTISFWTTREIARGKEVGKTSVISSMLFSTIAIIIYLVAVYFTGNLENVNQEIILMGVILVPTVFIKTTLYALNIGWKPQISSYSLLLGEIIKIPFVIYFLYFLEMGVFGVIIGVTISNLASILFLLYFGRKKIQVKFSIIILKKWIKYSWYTLYAAGISHIKTFDMIIFVLIVESVSGIAFYAAGFAIAKIIGNSASIASTTYSKLLSGSKETLLSTSLTRLIFVMFPLGMISIFFSKQAMFILNPIYIDSIIIIPIITVGVGVTAINIVLSHFLYGIDKVDNTSKIKFRDFTSSKLFKIKTYQGILNFSYIVILVVGLILIKEYSNQQIDLILFWALSYTIMQIPFTIYLSKSTKNNFKIKLEKISIIKYIISSIISILLFSFISENFIDYNESIIELILKVIFFVSCGIITYIIITYFIDQQAKNFVKQITKEIKLKK